MRGPGTARLRPRHALAWRQGKGTAIDETPIRRGRRGAATVRTRVLGYLVALTAAAIAITGVTVYVLQRAAIDRSIADSLYARTDAFLDYASLPDPSTGEPWASMEDLMRAAFSQVAATPTESAVGHVGGEPRFVPRSDEGLSLKDDPDFLALAEASATSAVKIQVARTSVTEYAYVSVPIVNNEGQVLATFTVATDRAALHRQFTETFALYLVSGVLALATVAAIGFVTVGRLLRPIRLLDETAREISETDLSQRIPIVGNDDLARLSETVNDMLDRLEGAFAAQRQLLDDAGHELRTPLAVMRTTLDLLEPRDADQVAESQALLLDEVGMMSRLVDDLVVLAKSERPEFVRPGDVALGALTDSVAARASALGERAWSVGARADVTVRGDEDRLSQAWMQLVSNAVKFSEPGSPVTLGSEVVHGAAGDEARLWVKDAGRGLRPEDQPRVLERFQRVDDSVEGAGLGLPIVAAIARAHGGRVEVDSALGVGSRFSIVIPAGRNDRSAP